MRVRMGKQLATEHFLYRISDIPIREGDWLALERATASAHLPAYTEFQCSQKIHIAVE